MDNCRATPDTPCMCGCHSMRHTSGLLEDMPVSGCSDCKDGQKLRVNSPAESWDSELEAILSAANIKCGKSTELHLAGELTMEELTLAFQLVKDQAKAAINDAVERHVIGSDEHTARVHPNINARMLRNNLRAEQRSIIKTNAGEAGDL